MAYNVPGTQFQMANIFEVIEKFLERRALGHATAEETWQKFLILGWRDYDTDEFFYINIRAMKESLSDLDGMLEIGELREDGSLVLPGLTLFKVQDKDAMDRMRALKEMPWKEKLGHTQAEFREMLQDQADRAEFFSHP